MESERIFGLRDILLSSNNKIELESFRKMY